MNYLIGFLWFFRIAKSFSFYLYLWQLKEYHIWRFKAHFETKEGRKLLLNNIFFAKILLLFFYFFSFSILLYYIFIFLLFLIYLIQFIKLVPDLIKRKTKLPVFTFKIIIITTFLFIIEVVFFLFVFNLNQFFFYLLLFDIFSPLIVSFVVLSLQPFTFLLRNLKIKKAIKKRESFKNLKVIGITGSYGKTSTKEFLFNILNEKFNVLKTPGHINSEIGISNTILNELNSAHDIFICEMGAYNKGGIKLLSKIAKPTIGILTGINQQHLSLFRTMKKLFSAEGGKELLNFIPKDGFMVINGNSDYVFNLYLKENKKKIYFSLLENVELEEKTNFSIVAKEVKEKESELFFTVKIEDKQIFKCKANLLGKQNIENLLLAIFVSYKLGMTKEEILRGISNIRQEQGGVTMIKNDKDFKIIDATYSSNPNSVMALLDYLNNFSLEKTIIMPCLIELGKSSKKNHKEIGAKIAKVCDLAIITTKDYYKEIKEGADIKKNNIIFSNNPEEIAKKIKEKRGVVLLKGRLSKGIIEKLKELISLDNNSL